MPKFSKKWALAVLGPVLAFGFCLPLGARGGADRLPVQDVSPALRRELEALIADENNLLNTLVSDRQLARAARQGRAAALRWDEAEPLPVGGYAQPVRVQRLVLLDLDGLRCAAVWAEGRQSVFALDGELARLLPAKS